MLFRDESNELLDELFFSVVSAISSEHYSPSPKHRRVAPAEDGREEARVSKTSKEKREKCHKVSRPSRELHWPLRALHAGDCPKGIQPKRGYAAIRHLRQRGLGGQCQEVAGYLDNKEAMETTAWKPKFDSSARTKLLAEKTEAFNELPTEGCRSR